MASIDKRLLAAYRQSLDRVCSGAGSATMKALEQWLGANPGASVAEIREAAIELTSDILGSYGDAASSLACDLFDSVMEAEGVSVPAAQVYDGVREGAVEGTVRRVVGDVDGTQESLDAFMQSVGQFTEDETRRAASSTIEQNVERASKTKAGRDVRYARVPTGAVPCEWCAMLASRGFVYRSAQRAEAASHHRCTCTIVPGVQGRTKVAGYDPDHYLDVWQNREKYESESSLVAEFNLATDDLVRYEGGKTADSLPKGSMDAMVAFADDFNSKYPALRDAEGTYPLGLSNLTVCSTKDIAEEGGIDIEEAKDVLGMFMRAKDGSINAGIYMNADLLSSCTLDEVVSDFRHEYGHYVAWFLQKNGVDGGEAIALSALHELIPNYDQIDADAIELLIRNDLSNNAAVGWAQDLHGEVFAEAFRVWQEGGESQLAAIIGSKIDSALRGLG